PGGLRVLERPRRAPPRSRGDPRDGGARRVTRPSILFRADASHTLGLGHVARLCAMIEEVDPAIAEPVALFGGDDSVAAWIRSHGLPVAPRPWTPAEVLATATERRARTVVIDGPDLAATLVPVLAERGI